MIPIFTKYNIQSDVEVNIDDYIYGFSNVHELLLLKQSTKKMFRVIYIQNYYWYIFYILLSFTLKTMVHDHLL